MRAWVLIVVAVVAFGCPADDETTGKSDTSSTGAGGEKEFEPPACGGVTESFTNADCATCAEASCCAELEACADDTPCRALLDCRATCFDSACVDACASANASGDSAADAYDACLAGPCSASCPMNPGVCGTAFSTGVADCDTCVGASCCTELDACMSDVACGACLEGFQESCAADPAYTALTGCFGQSCASVCEG